MKIVLSRSQRIGWRLVIVVIWLATLGACGSENEVAEEENEAANSLRLIAFTSTHDGDAEIYLINADGTNQMRLTDNEANDLRPAWSPDGKKIAFTSDRDGNQEIYVMSAAGTNQIRLTNNEVDDWEPNWSPDGKQLVFKTEEVDDTGYRYEEIYLMDSDGSNRRPINVSTNITDGAPTWSPDGRYIAYSGGWRIDVYDIENERYLPLTNGNSAHPTWSPDGKHIAFQSNREGSLNLYLLNVDGSDHNANPTGITNPANYVPTFSPASYHTRLTNHSANDSQPAWSPDGTQIAFSSKRDGEWNIYVMNADGSSPTRLTNEGLNLDPTWAPLVVSGGD